MPKKSSLEKKKEIAAIIPDAKSSKNFDANLREPEPEPEPDSESSSSDSDEPVLKPVKVKLQEVKPKKVLTEKQKQAFEKARLVRSENIKARKEIKEKEDAKIQKLLDEKKAKKEAKLKKKQDLELKKIETSSDESSDDEVVVKKKKKI
jgi:hypothetical protein